MFYLFWNSLLESQRGGMKPELDAGASQKNSALTGSYHVSSIFRMQPAAQVPRGNRRWIGGRQRWSMV